jgi:hypothetical protein
MFGDWNWLHERMEQQRRQEKVWFQGVVNSLSNIVIVELGAGTAIPSVRHYCQRISKEFGARIIRINPREFDVQSKQDVGLPMGSLEALRGIDLALTLLAGK